MSIGIFLDGKAMEILIITSANISFVISEDTQIRAIFDKTQYDVNAQLQSYGIVENPSKLFPW